MGHRVFLGLMLLIAVMRTLEPEAELLRCVVQIRLEVLEKLFYESLFQLINISSAESVVDVRKN